MRKEMERNLKMIDRLAIDEQKIKLTKKLEHKLGNVDGEDVKKAKRSFKKKLEKETERRQRKTTDKKYKKTGHAKK